MDTILEDFEFLDLSDASDLERDRIKGILVRPVADHFQTPWNPPPPAPPSQQQPLPPPQPAAPPPPATAYHGGVQLNGGGGGGSTPYQAPPPTMMAPPPAAAPAPAPRPVVQLNPQAGVFVNTQPFPPAPYYPQSGPPGEAVVVGRQGPRPGGGKKRDVTASAMPPPPPHVIWNQPAAHHYYPGAAPLIVGQFSPVHPGPPATAYVAPEQELKEQVPYSPYNPHPPHHQQHHHLPHHHHQPHYPQEQHHHHQHHHHQQQRHPMQMAPAPVTITAPPPPVPAPPITVPPPVPAPVPVVAPVPVAVPPQVAAPVPVAVPPQVAAPVPVAAPVTITAPPPTAVGVPVLPPSTAVQIVPLKFNSGNQLINGPKQMIRGDRQLVKPAGGPATAVETKARVKSVATVTVKEEKPQPVNSNPPAAAVVKVENEEKKVVVTSSNDEQPKVKQEEPAAAKSNDVTSQPTAATVKPAEVQPSPQPPVNAAPQVTAPPPPAVTVPPPTVTAPVAPAAPSYASLFSNSSSSPASRGAAAPPSRRYSGAAPAPVQVNHVASGGEQFDRGASPRTSATASKEGQHQQQKTSVMSPPQQKVNSVPPPLNAVTSSSASSVNNVSPLAGDPGLLRLAEYLSTYKLDHRATLLRPRGLTNRSNYCYINATLQALLACPPLYNLLKRLPIPPRKSHSASKSKTPIIDSMVQFVNEFEEIANAPSLIKSRREKHQAARDDKQQTETVPTGPAFEPSYIYRMMNNVIRNESAFPVEGRQEDAEEFLSCLLNGLNDEMVELLRLTEDSSVSNGEVIATNGDNSMDQDSDNEWKEISKKKPTITRRTKLVSTPLSQIFQGQWRSRVVRQGASETDNIQPFFTFPLDIEKAPSVKEALDNITAKNMLEGFTCPKTNRTIEAYQQLYLEELPLVLLLHLKCFDYRLQTCSKIIKNVEFTIELKIDAKLMAGSGKKATNNNNTNNTRSASSIKEREYKLFAVVYHDGKEATKGHYVADVYHVGYSTWLRYDDANVRVVPQSQVLMPRPPRVPYLLYYRRKDTIAPQPNANAKPQKTATNES